MKTSVRILLVLLAAFMTLSCFVACNSSAKNDETTPKQDNTASIDSVIEEETLDPEIHPNIEKTNYEEDCYLHVFESMGRLWVEESDDDVFTEALFARQQKLYDYLGVELYGIQTGNLHEYGDAFTTAVKNKDGSVDVLVCSAYVSIADFIIDGYLRDYNDFDQIDLSADYWKLDYMEEVMLGDAVYLGYSEFNIFNTHALAYNKRMLEQYSDALDESIYDTVRNYRWTIDKMISLANLVYIDQTADGKTADDTFGITGHQWIPFIGFLHACDIPLVEQDDSGAYRVSVYNSTYQDKTTDLVEKLLALSKSDSAYFRFKIEETENIPLSSGRVLMHIHNVGGLVGLLNYDIEFGVVPFPMYDENQKDVGYRSFNYDGFITFPSYMRNENMSVETIEILSFFSDPVQTAYYEKQLGKQASDTPDDSEMLKLIWDGICTDFGLAYSYISPALDTNLYMLPTLTQANTTHAIASYVKSYENTANKAIDKWMKTYNVKFGK